MFERFTERARQVVVLCPGRGRTLEHGYRGTEHLLLGVLASSRGVAGRETIRRTIARMLADTGSGEA